MGVAKEMIELRRGQVNTSAGQEVGTIVYDAEALAEATPTTFEFASPSQRAALIERLDQAKKAFVTRRVDLDLAWGLSRACDPRSGDLILATVTELGHHSRIELPNGRRAQLYIGDEIVVAYGERYAPDQFHAVVPAQVAPCHLVAGGGIAATMLARHAQTRKPTEITPSGVLVGADGSPLNLSQFALSRPARRPIARNVIAVVGTSMNSGKTTLAANLIRGLTLSGIRVGACKVTGTGSGGDLWNMVDAGAVHAFDFTDVGYSTTAGLDVAAVDRAANTLVSHIEELGADIVVVEIADGLLQRETAALLEATSSFSSRIDALFLAAADSMGAHAGVEWLRARNLPLRAVSGLVTASPLAAREARDSTGVEVIQTKAFADPDYAAKLCLRMHTARGSLSVIS
jgi:hypothetical protein